MGEQWQFQVRVTLGDEFASLARRDPSGPALAKLSNILKTHNATMKCQFDAFADYVREAEKSGVEAFPLYAWTKATIENSAKKAKYLKSFTLYVNGEEVYAKDKAYALEAELQPLFDGKMITRISKHDTNPANNPQPPERYRS